MFICVCSSVKVHVRTSASFTRDVEEGQQRILAHFVTPPQLVNLSTPLDVGTIAANLNTAIENFNSRGSGWQFDHIARFELVITEYRPLCGGSSSYVETPKRIADKHCIINVKNDQGGDQKCFLWSVLSCTLYDRLPKDKNRLGYYRPHEKSLKVEGMTFPVPLKDIHIFEALNTHISVNVISIDKYDEAEKKYSFCIDYVSPYKNRKHKVNMLLLEDEEDPTKKHYTYISNFSRLLGDRTKHNGATYICNYCLHPFTDKQAHDNHLPYCQDHPAQHVEYPTDDPTLKFKSLQKTYKLPFWLVADLEAYITPIDGVDADNDDEVDDDDDVCGMRPIDEHRVSGFCCYRVTSHPAYETEPFVYSGPNVLDVFYDHVLREAQLINAIVADDQDMIPMTSTERREYEEATHCGNCGIAFTIQNNKVRHHDHISGQYLFACCNNCNLQLKPVRRGDEVRIRRRIITKTREKTKEGTNLTSNTQKTITKIITSCR